MINARILVRKGLKADFDPTKMLPGEWAVSIDASTSNQIVWMCFAPGVCKRMGTYEDFQNMVYNATGQIIERYEDAFGSILEEVNTNAEAVSANTDIVLVAKSDIINTYLPQIKSYVSNASASASKAKTYSENAKASASEADKSAEDAKKYSQNAFSTTPEGYEVLVGDVDLLKNSIIQTTERTLYGSNAGGIKLIGIKGASEQGENPSPDNPQEIESVGIENLANDDYLDIYANNDTKVVAQSSGIISILIKVKPNTTYLLGRDGGTQYSTIGFFNTIPQAGDAIDNMTYIGSTITKSITTLEDTNYILWYVATTGGVTFSKAFCYETTATDAEYKPYGYSLGIKASNEDSTKSKSITIPLNEPLRKGDEIVVVNGVWGVNRVPIEETIDGSKGSFSYADANNNEEYIFFYNSSILTAPTDNTAVNSKADVLCDKFVSIESIYRATTYQEGVGVHQVGSNNARFEIRIKRERLSSEDETGIKAWLAENPVTVQYNRAAPTFEPFTDQTPFYDLESFDTVTYISTDSKVEPNVILKFAKTEGDAITLGNYNRTKRNEIHISELMALQTELAAALVAGSEV